MKRFPLAVVAVFLSLLGVGSAVWADDAPPKAARSVHLGYAAPEAHIFYNELTVNQSTPGSYFMAAGFSHGYFGIQELGDGRKVALFSVWDPEHGDKDSADQRVQTIFAADDVRVKRFGGEGTGGQCMFDFDWAIGQTYRFMIKSAVTEDNTTNVKRTQYAGWLFLPKTASWKHLVTFSTITRGEQLTGLYSFVEDFRRDTKSAQEIRRATYGNGWVKTVKGEWTPLVTAHFTASDATWEAKQTIDAGLVGDPAAAFYLQTGGATVNHAPLGSPLHRPPGSGGPPDVPAD